MKSVSLCLLVTLAAAGPAPRIPPAADAELGRAVAAENGPPNGQEGEACSLLEPIVAELFEVTPDVATFRAVELGGNDVCRVIWEIPDLTPEEQRRRAVDNELRYNNEVSLTLMGTTFDSPEAAVVSLEQSVATLQEGITTTIAGRERTIQRDFGDWIEGLGDRAIQGETSVLVAAGGRRFTVGVGVSDDDEENLELATELARRVVSRL